MIWQPIETAPKDGTKILLKLRDSDVSHSGYYKIRYGWRIAWDDHDLSEHDGPTHWMHLPPATGHDLSSVVVVDREVMEEVKVALRHACTNVSENARNLAMQALASLNAGGDQ